MVNINTNTYEIDSFILKIPYEKVVNIGGFLNEETEITSILTKTGLIVDTETKIISTHHTKTEEIPTTYEVRTFFNNSKQIRARQTFYLIKVTSKHLKEKYFEGITLNNINDVYDSIMSQKVIYIEYNDFLQSVCYDVDLMKMVYISNYYEVLKQIKNCNPPQTERLKIINTFSTKDNEGFEFSNRKHATISTPFIKIYNKEKQINSINKKGMTEFYNKYLDSKNYNIENLYRIEFTLKGKQMIEKYGLSKSNKLIDLLNVKKEIKEGVAKDIFSIYTEKPIKDSKVPVKLNATEKYHLMVKDLCIQNGYSHNQIEQYIKGYNFSYEVQKKFLSNIEKIDFEGEEKYLNEKLQINNEVQKTLKEIGIF